MDNLISIVHKISNYVPWQHEGLTEDEFRVLDQARGIELAQIAYENRINFSRFLKNADKMIDKYNEKLLQIQIKEVRALKRTLQVNVAYKKSKLLTKEAETIDRNVQAIQEVPELPELPEILNENLIIETGSQIEQISNVPIEAQTVPTIRTFQSTLDDCSNSIPMIRDCVRETNNITFDKNLPVQQNEEMPVLSDIEIMQMGLYNYVKTSRAVPDVSKSVIIPDVLIAQANDLIVEQSNIQPPPPPPPLLDDFESMHIHEQMNPVELVHELQPLDVVDEPNDVQRIELQQQQVESTILNSELRESDRITNVRNSMADRLEEFRNAINAADVMLRKAKKRIRRPQRANRRDNYEEDEDDEVLTLLRQRKDIQIRSKRRNRARGIKHWKQNNIDFNIFDDVEIFLSNDFPFEEDQELQTTEQRQENRLSDFNLELLPAATGHRVLTSTPMNLAQKKRANLSPETSNISKRMRTIDKAGGTVIQPTENIPAIQEISESTKGSEFLIPDLPVSIQEPDLIPEIEPIPVEQDQLDMIDRQMNEIHVHIPQPIETEQSIINEPPQDPTQMPIPQNLENSNNLSKDQSIPQARRITRSALLENLHIRADSINYEQLLRNAQLRKTPLDLHLQIPPDEIFQNAVENISEREIAKSGITFDRPRIRFDPPCDVPVHREENLLFAESSENFTEFQKVVINDRQFIEVRSDDENRKLQLTETQLKCIQLYTKIRIIMKTVMGSNPWRMSIKDMLGHLTDLKEPKFVTYQRIKHLAQEKLFIPKYTDDGNQLLEIEIPINRFDEPNNKENDPIN